MCLNTLKLNVQDLTQVRRVCLYCVSGCEFKKPREARAEDSFRRCKLWKCQIHVRTDAGSDGVCYKPWLTGLWLDFLGLRTDRLVRTSAPATPDTSIGGLRGYSTLRFTTRESNIHPWMTTAPSGCSTLPSMKRVRGFSTLQLVWARPVLRFR